MLSPGHTRLSERELTLSSRFGIVLNNMLSKVCTLCLIDQELCIVWFLHFSKFCVGLNLYKASVSLLEVWLFCKVLINIGLYYL